MLLLTIIQNTYRERLRHTTMQLTKWNKGLTVSKIHAHGARQYIGHSVSIMVLDLVPHRLELWDVVLYFTI